MSDTERNANFTSAVAGVAATVRDARLAAGYSQDDLALTCGLTIAEIRDVEYAIDTNPTRLRRIFAALRL